MPKDFEYIYSRWRNGELSNEQAAALCKFSIRTLYSLTAEWREAERQGLNVTSDINLISTLQAANN